MNTYKKMYVTNAKVKKWLVANGYTDIHLFPHTRFVKDLHLQGLDFDGIAALKNQLVLFQCKTNCKATKKTLIEYKALEKKFGIICLWFNRTKKGLEVNNEK